MLLVFSSWKENGKACINNKRREKDFATQEHRFHSYVVIIHNFGSKPIHVVHCHVDVKTRSLYEIGPVLNSC
jgi:hypothetical protein